MNFEIDHIGIAVENLDASIAKYRNDFEYDLELRETVHEQDVEVAFLGSKGTMIELLQPLSRSCALYRSIERRGCGLHHICYKVTDIEGELVRFKSLGYELIDAAPRTGARNSKIAFIHPKSMGGVLTELLQYL